MLHFFDEVWDLVMCDYNTPLFSAPDALNMMEDTSIDIPFIVVSGAVGEKTAVEVMKAGARDLVGKDNLVQ